MCTCCKLLCMHPWRPSNVPLTCCAVHALLCPFFAPPSPWCIHFCNSRPSTTARLRCAFPWSLYSIILPPTAVNRGCVNVNLSAAGGAQEIESRHEWLCWRHRCSPLGIIQRSSSQRRPLLQHNFAPPKRHDIQITVGQSELSARMANLHGKVAIVAGGSRGAGADSLQGRAPGLIGRSAHAVATLPAATAAAAVVPRRSAATHPAHFSRLRSRSSSSPRQRRGYCICHWAHSARRPSPPGWRCRHRRRHCRRGDAAWRQGNRRALRPHRRFPGEYCTQDTTAGVPSMHGIWEKQSSQT